MAVAQTVVLPAAGSFIYRGRTENPRVCDYLLEVLRLEAVPRATTGVRHRPWPAGTGLQAVALDQAAAAAFPVP